MYEETFHTELNVNTALSIAIKVFEELEWVLVYQGQDSVVAHRKIGHGRIIEKIGVTYECGIVSVKSKPPENVFWSRWINSKKVKLFIHTFQITANALDKESLKKLGDEYENDVNWNNYQIPEELPKPKRRISPNLPLILISGITAAVFCGYLVAYMIAEGMHVIGFFEFGVALVIGIILTYLIKLSNYTNYNSLKLLLAGMIFTTYLSAEYFEYKIITGRYDIYYVGFAEYLNLKTQSQLPVPYLNTSLTIFIIGRILQLGFTYYICYIFAFSRLSLYQVEKIPVEVVYFAHYHLLKEKTEDEVRFELEKKGWEDKQCQDEVFDAIAIIRSENETYKNM
ncbi:MAG: hypothetical protein LBV74_16250 [Tannerella sp.]|jgi:hypothetical protein|nr:hypothetical protein [Tannerella sp.]